MPYLKLDTNVVIAEERVPPLLGKLSAALAATTGKPERSMQIVVAPRSHMLLAGSEDATAHVEVKGISFPEDCAAAVTRELCAVLQEELAIEGKRVYVAFSSYKGSMWGVDSHTF